MPRYKLTIEFDGTNYAGWQRQNDRPSVQGSLETAVQQFSGEAAEVIGAGRTDAGVHATAMIAHFDMARDSDPFSVMQGLNFYLFGGNEGNILNNRIAVIAAEKVTEEFHARFSAKKRHYLYRIINRRPRLGLEANRAWHVVEDLDVAAMNKAAQVLIGTHDFSSFRDTACQAKSPVKTLEQLDVKRIGGEVHVFASARSFLHHQVRIMVGTLAMAGKGKWSVQDVQKALAAKHRTEGGPTAPPDGLYLVKVDY